MTPGAYYFISTALIFFLTWRVFVLSTRPQRPIPGEPGYQLPRETTSRGVIEARLSPEGDIASWVPVSSEPDPNTRIRLVMGSRKSWIAR